jgi:hypothetical protein
MNPSETNLMAVTGFLKYRMPTEAINAIPSPDHMASARLRSTFLSATPRKARLSP